MKPIVHVSEEMFGLRRLQRKWILVSGGCKGLTSTTYPFTLSYSGIPISQTSRGNANWFEKLGVQEIGGEITSEANPRETRFGSRYREVRETEGPRNRDSTVDK